MILLAAIAVLTVLTAVLAVLKINKQKHYRQLEELQKTISASHENRLRFHPYQASDLPSFGEKIITIPDFLPRDTFTLIKDAVLTGVKTERSYFPAHKQGGTVAYEALHTTAPEVVAFYLSLYLRQFCSTITGQRVIPTPINDQSSCSLLFYEKPRDHIGWHYDYNFYNGRHFTALLPIVNRHNSEDRCSSANLVVQRENREIIIPTPPNTFILFEGAYTYHKVTRLDENETRIILSMTFCTDPAASMIKSYARRFKDIAYFGIRALWT